MVVVVAVNPKEAAVMEPPAQEPEVKSAEVESAEVESADQQPTDGQPLVLLHGQLLVQTRAASCVTC